MDSIDKQVAERFVAFEKEQNPTLVYEALALVEEAARDVPTGDTAARRRAVSHWLDFLAGLDRAIDPTWDPANVPTHGVTPPAHHGMVYGTGEVDPATIPDPVARAEYERALQANKDENKRYSVQLQLRRIDEQTMRVVGLLLGQRYTASPADRREFEELLTASPASGARKKRLRAFMPQPV